MSAARRRLLASFAICTLIGIGAAVALMCFSAVLAARAEPITFAALQAAYRSSDAQLLDRSGEPLQRLRVDKSIRRLQWIALSDISPALLRAVIDAEDQRFYQHRGVDWWALSSAAWDNLLRRQTTQKRLRGASTISMQLAAALTLELKPANNGRTLTQKWQQIIAARELENSWSKPQILEAYLNLISYRGELQGIDAAAQGLFGKVPSGLNNNEALVLAALIRAPAASIGAVGRRACALARDMHLDKRCEDIEWTAMLALSNSNYANKSRIDGSQGPAQRIAEKMLTEHSLKDSAAQLRMISTIDAKLQRFALDDLQQQLTALKPRNVNDGAIVVLDNASGEVLAYVANGGHSGIDGVAALRQAGSTLKPFLYQLAIEHKQLTAASVLDDAPLDIVTPGGLYVPQNYDRSFKGLVSVRTSLGSSLNVPAVRTLLLSGTNAFYARLKALGFTGLTQPADYYGYALALGSAEVSLLELANAYRAFANRGAWSPVVLQPGAVPKVDSELKPNTLPARNIMEEGAAFIVADILSDNGARSATFGLDNILVTPFWSAAKTGTSKDMRDNWCVGFSEKFTVGVWVGNFDGQPMWDVSGVTGAAPVWRDVMNYLHASIPSRAPKAPATVVARNIEFKPQLESARREWFIAGTESNTIEVLTEKERLPKIQYPGNGVIIAFDPDIPLHNQRVLFKARAGQNLFWQLDGALSVAADQALHWQPVAGKHTLELVDANAVVLDKVRFDVRGVPR
jgi:penicillin-binding protein 1C